MQKLLTLFIVFISIQAISQPVQIYVDYYDRDEEHIRSEGKFENGKEVGTWKYYYKSGQLKEECEYKQGGFHGKTTIWFENGQMQHEGWFKFSLQDSLYTEWNEEGNIIAQGYYDMGVKDSVWNYYYQHGKLKNNPLTIMEMFKYSIIGKKMANKPLLPEMVNYWSITRLKYFVWNILMRMAIKQVWGLVIIQVAK